MGPNPSHVRFPICLGPLYQETVLHAFSLMFLSSLSSSQFATFMILMLIWREKAEAWNLLVMERGWRPNLEISPPCPRCGSSNTKFCYYNNYSLTQPRYFCKGCRRYWTKGGSLRSVPVGGGCRKSRRGNGVRISSTDASSSSRIGSAYNGGSSPQGRNSSIESTTSSSPKIDLALVYANFLNLPPPPPPPDTATTHRMLEASAAADDLPDFSEMLMDMGFRNNGNAILCCGLDSFGRKMIIPQQLAASDNNINGLPPLPGDEDLLDSEQMLWSNPSLTTTSNPTLNVEAHAPPETESEYQDSNRLTMKSNGPSYFDLSTCEAFFRS